ncbi:hypothetical protein G5B39_06795 [Rhodobacteraceae bacterium SC52]|nr:hypothetical protein G5B39_06795 [Rhodobacteraceae bacterium SC52]
MNKKVDDIYLKHKVRRQAEDLLVENARLRALILQAPYAPRDHNNPPEILELDHQRYSEVCEAASVAQDAVQEIATEARKEAPSLGQLEISASKLSEAVNTVLRYLGAKLDLAIDTLIKWGVPAGMMWVVTNQDKISLMLSDVRTLVGAALP